MASFSPIPRDPATVLTGMRDPTAITSQRVIADVKDRIAQYEPESAPLTAILMKLQERRKVTQYSFDTLSQDPYPRSVYVSGAQTSGDTSIELATGQGTRVAANYVLLNKRTREHIHVSSISNDTLTVVRNIGGINEAMNDGDELVFTRAVFEDGADIGTLKSPKEARQFNYTEIIRTPYGVSGRQLATNLYGGRDLPYLRKIMGIEHAKSIENMLLFGRRHTRTGAGGLPQTYAGGLEYFLTSNVWDLQGNIPEERDFVAWMEHVMTLGMGGNIFGSGTKYFFCSARWLSTIERWGRDKLEYRPMDTEIGIKVAKFNSAHGTLFLVRHPLLTGTYHGGMGFLVDLNHCAYAYHQERDTAILEGRQGNGIDGESEEYRTDCSFDIELEASCGIVKGLPTN